MRKGIVWALIAAVALCAAALLFFRGKPAAAGDTVVVTVDGREYARVPVGQRQLITVRQDNGAENVVEITARGAVMRSSTCENQLCVHMGEVTLDNWEYRPNGAFIICLPNRVSVELAVSE